MVLSDAIKRYLAEVCGDGSVTEAGCDKIGLACMTGGALPSPLPSGVVRADLCNAELYDWCYANMGYTPPGAPPADKGTLTVTTSPTGALVMVNGVSCGTTPVYTCELSTGAKTVTITKSGYNTVTRNITITAGQTSNLGTITLTPTATGDKGWVSLCSLPAGADIYIDGAKVPWSAPLCPAAARNYEVTARVMHTVKFVLANYKDKTINFSIGVGGTWQAHAVLEAVAGPNTGTLRLTAHDAVTGQELYARPAIAGTTMEEKLLTPLTINLSIPTGATSKEYEVGAIHPGYEKEVTTVILRKTHTPASPLVVDLRMKESKVWREVRIVEKMPRVAWVTGISIPSVMQWGINYTGWVKFIFTLAARYRAHLDFHARPSGWDGRLESLPARTTRITTGEEDLTPWPDNEQKLDWAWTVPSAGSVPEGTYVIVCVIEYEE